MSTISIIGAGTMAAAIGGRAVAAGHTVEVTSRDPEKARALAERLGAGATTGTYGGVPSGDIVVLAVLAGGAAAVITDHGDALAGKTIVDITNPIAPDLSGVDTPAGSSGAQELQKIAPAGAAVVKAFNTLFGSVLARGEQLDVFFAADDPQAVQRVTDFIAGIGMRPLHVGELFLAHALEELALLLIGVARNGAGSFDIALKIDQA
jgi:8-hydroxy-5-deazaflavin:NADPH oxidoreductase